ncbi:MAG TPA: hypothetical protein PKV41_02350 [Candidatus Omnitrophota bacterium]|nr:hypothetical protein [Candidatus Omnitrophota bacterium]
MRLRAVRRIAAISVLLWMFAGPVFAAHVLYYKTYHSGTGEIFNRFHCSIARNSSGGYQVHWVIEENGTATEEDYALNENFETMRFRVVNLPEQTDYVGERRNNYIFIRGQFKGKKVEHGIEIDARPLYYNPKIGLTAFVQSGRKEEKFWGFQNRELKVYPMKATNEGPETISVGGRDVEAIKVHWTVDDFRSAFFKRTYWFRQADGLYLKQKSSDGTFRELVSEERQSGAP